MRVLSLAETSKRLGLGERTLRRMSERGEFIAPVQISTRRVGYIEAELERWLERRPKGKFAPVCVRHDSKSLI